jgi:hypothetical protein
MTRLQRITLLVVVSDIVLLVGYDLWAAAHGGPPATISWLISWSAQQWWGSTIVFAFGYLMGHFFAQDQSVHLGTRNLRKQ